MTNKIKLFFGFLALIALFSVFTFFNSFGNFPSTFSKPLAGSVLEAVNQDADKDGLNNREESYWNTDFQNPDTDSDGFLDGEEVTSGHDPLKPGPDDILPGRINLTKEISSLTLGGLVEGSLKSNNDAYITSVNLVVDELFNQYAQNSSIETNEIRVVESNKENKKKYAQETLPLVESYLGQDLDSFIQLTEKFGSVDLSKIDGLINDEAQYFDFVNYLHGERDKIRDQITQLEGVSVPKDFVDQHNQLITFLKSIQKNYVLMSDMKNDPVQGLLAFNTLINIFLSHLSTFVGSMVNNLVSNSIK